MVVIIRFVLRRLATLIPIFLGISLVASILFYIVPGDIVLVMLGQHVDPVTYANVKKGLGMDISFWQNYCDFLKGLVKGDLGYSYIQQRPVSTVILEVAPVTVRLGIIVIGFAFTGTLLGVVAAIKEKELTGASINFLSIISYSLPSFVLALFLQYIIGVKLGWLPVSGASHGIRSYILPAVALGIPWTAVYARIARASMAEVITQEHYRYALCRGIPEKRVIIRHGLRNALFPVFTYLGISISGFFAGFVLTETVFNLPGIGRLVYSSINTRDFPVLRGILLLSAFITVISNLAVDLLYTKFDPKMASEIIGDENHVSG